jgi:hypothetical protein
MGGEVIKQSRFDRFRMMFDRSHLLDRANATCKALNAQAGDVLIYSELFMDTHPVIGRYTIEDENVDITMELAILSQGPGVVFSSRKVRPWVKRVQRYCGYHPEEKIDVVCKLLINPAAVTDAEIKEWFTYLLSGLDHSFKPHPMEPILLRSWLGAVCPTLRF